MTVTKAIVHPSPVKAAPTALPDYGGRDGVASAVDSSGGQALNPLAQAGRALEALVIVLALVAGGLYLLKRSGLLKGDGTPTGKMPAVRGSRESAQRSSYTILPASDLITVLGSQTLPNASGADLHLVSIGGRTLLLGATAHQVTVLTELDRVPDRDEAETPEAAVAFSDYLSKLGLAPEPKVIGRRSAEAALSSTADRLQLLLARSRD